MFLWRRRHSEPSTDTCINPYIVLNVRVGFRRFQTCSCSLSLDGSIDFVEHTVCRVSEVSVADAQRLSLTRHGWGAQDEVDRRIQGRRFDTLCHTFAETAPTFLLSRTFIPNNSLALIAFSQGGMIAFASAHNPNWPGFSKSSKFSILEWISSRSFR